jgi:hypothetical protein
MDKRNGNYKREFKDSEYEKHLRFWMGTVRTMADSFFEASFDIGDSKIVPARISYPPNLLLIDRAIINAFSDLARIKDYHYIGYPDPKNRNIGHVATIKFVAYIGYWLAKAKPFSLCVREYSALPNPTDGKLRTKAEFNFCFSINEVFIAEFILATVFKKQVSKDRLAASESCLCMRKEGDCDFVSSSTTSGAMSDTILDSLLYYLSYRLRGAQELELFLKGLLACPVECSRMCRNR